MALNAAKRYSAPIISSWFLENLPQFEYLNALASQAVA
jgi:hypothetical protein